MQFLFRGGVYDADSLKRAMPKAVRPKSEGDAEWHKGWLVEGYPPGFVDQAKREADEACAAWSAMSPDARAAAEKDGQRPPKPWDEDLFARTGKRKRVARPYGIDEAAKTCADLAIKAGWTHVEVTELKKAKQ